MGRKPRYRKSAMSGLLVVDKPLGWSSMDVVRKVRDAAGFVKTGHGGTLDPLATGVVIFIPCPAETNIHFPFIFALKYQHAENTYG